MSVAPPLVWGVTLELQEKVKNIICDNSSSFRIENFNKHSNSRMESLTPHSNYFSTLCLLDVMEFGNTEQMENCGDERQGP